MTWIILRGINSTFSIIIRVRKFFCDHSRLETLTSVRCKDNKLDLVLSKVRGSSISRLPISPNWYIRIIRSHSVKFCRGKCVERRAVHCLSEDCFIVERGLLREKLQLSFCCSRLRCHAIPQNAATYPELLWVVRAKINMHYWVQIVRQKRKWP